MDRRNFLQAMAAAAASLEALGGGAVAAESGLMTLAKDPERPVGTPVSTDGYTLVCEFKRRAVPWKVYEDLRARDGSIVFVPSAGETRELSKSAEASMAEGTKTMDPSRARKSSYTDRKSTRLNSSHVSISYAVFCLKK